MQKFLTQEKQNNNTHGKDWYDNLDNTKININLWKHTIKKVKIKQSGRRYL